MRYHSNEYTASRQHSHFSYKRKYQEGLYTHMLLEDLSQSFSIEFSPIREDDNFYYIDPPTDKLKSYLTFDDYGFFRYDLDKILQQTMYHLMTAGTAHMEIVLWRNYNNQVVGITLEPFSAVSIGTFKEKHLFFTKKPDKKAVFFSVPERHVIILDLKDLGFRRNYFRMLFRRMRPFETNLYAITEKKNIDFKAFTKQEEFRFLKLTKRIGWTGRNSGNQHLSEAYLLKRSIRFKTLKKQFLEYLLAQINLGLSRFRDELDFHGKIVTMDFDTEHTAVWEKMQKGECGFSAVSKEVYRF